MTMFELFLQTKNSAFSSLAKCPKDRLAEWKNTLVADRIWTAREGALIPYARYPALVCG
jgi:hypothetical protein